jgi:hypothetical protein
MRRSIPCLLLLTTNPPPSPMTTDSPPIISRISYEHICRSSIRSSHRRCWETDVGDGNAAARSTVLLCSLFSAFCFCWETAAERESNSSGVCLAITDLQSNECTHLWTPEWSKQRASERESQLLYKLLSLRCTNPPLRLYIFGLYCVARDIQQQRKSFTQQAIIFMNYWRHPFLKSQPRGHRKRPWDFFDT